MAGNNNANDREFVGFARELAGVAAPHTLGNFRTGGRIDNKAKTGQIDPVTAGDRDAEAAMRDLIECRYPEHGIVGEEYGSLRADADYVWVLDPIDGTRGFVLGLPTWGTLIGLLHKGSPTVGVMAQAFVGDLFVGSAAGAYLIRGSEERRLSTRPAKTLADASIATTTPDLFSTDERRLYDRVESRCGLVRYGTDCYAYALLAAGFIDLVVETGLKPFDIVALIPIVEAAGGVVTDWNGGEAAGGGQILAASSRTLHTEVSAILSGTK